MNFILNEQKTRTPRQNVLSPLPFPWHSARRHGASAMPPRHFLTSRNEHASSLIRKQLQLVSIPSQMHYPDRLNYAGVLLHWLRPAIRNAGMYSVWEERPPVEFVCFVICFCRRGDYMRSPQVFSDKQDGKRTALVWVVGNFSSEAQKL